MAGSTGSRAVGHQLMQARAARLLQQIPSWEKNGIKVVQVFSESKSGYVQVVCVWYLDFLAAPQGIWPCKTGRIPSGRA